MKPVLNENDNDNRNHEENEKILINFERQALHDTVNELFVNLCASDNHVRQALFDPKNLDLLCQFFGQNGGKLFMPFLEF